MIPDFETYCLNEKSVKSIKKILKGTMSSSDRHIMKKLLKKHVVYFMFKKKNGDLRKAVGTLISSYLPALRGGDPKPEHQMVYYDLDKEHWRSFRSYSFIKILNVKSEDEYLGKKPKLKHIEKEEEEKEKKLHKEIEKEEKEKHDDHDKHEDIKKKEYKVGDKIPEKELMRRSTDFRKNSKKNKFTKKSNDAFKKGDLDEDDENKEDKDKD